MTTSGIPNALLSSETRSRSGSESDLVVDGGLPQERTPMEHRIAEDVEENPPRFSGSGKAGGGAPPTEARSFGGRKIVEVIFVDDCVDDSTRTEPERQGVAHFEVKDGARGTVRRSLSARQLSRSGTEFRASLTHVMEEAEAEGETFVNSGRFAHRAKLSSAGRGGTPTPSVRADASAGPSHASASPSRVHRESVNIMDFGVDHRRPFADSILSAGMSTGRMSAASESLSYLVDSSGFLGWGDGDSHSLLSRRGTPKTVDAYSSNSSSITSNMVDSAGFLGWESLHSIGSGIEDDNRKEGSTARGNNNGDPPRKRCDSNDSEFPKPSGSNGSILSKHMKLLSDKVAQGIIVSGKTNSWRVSGEAVKTNEGQRGQSSMNSWRTSSGVETNDVQRRRSSINSWRASGEAVKTNKVQRGLPSMNSWRTSSGAVETNDVQCRRSSINLGRASGEAVKTNEIQRGLPSMNSWRTSSGAVKTNDIQRRRSSINSWRASGEAVKTNDANGFHCGAAFGTLFGLNRRDSTSSDPEPSDDESYSRRALRINREDDVDILALRRELCAAGSDEGHAKDRAKLGFFRLER